MKQQTCNGNGNGNVHNAHPSMTSTHTYELTDAPCKPDNVDWNSILITNLLCSHHRSLVDSEDFQHEKHLVLCEGYDSESSSDLVLDFTPHTLHDHFR